MAEVRMNIKEYNELRDELIEYKRALQELLTPVEDSWAMEWYKEHPDSEMTLRSATFNNLSNSTKTLILPIMKGCVSQTFGDIGVFSEEDMFVNLGSFCHYPSEETAEDSES